MQRSLTLLRLCSVAVERRFVALASANTHRASNDALQQRRYKSSLPTNFGIVFVPQQEAWVVERMGKYLKVLEPGLSLLIPLLDRISYVQSLKEIAIEIPSQSAITVDNVALQIDGVLYLRVIDPYKASYGVEDPEFAITQLAQTTMRSEVGKIDLDTVFRERETLNDLIVASINKASSPWGILCMRYEIRDMQMPPKIKEAMQMQVEAERRKRAAILESEGKRDAEINVASGKRKAQILRSEAQMQESINLAEGDAQAIRLRATARRQAIQAVSEALSKEQGNNAAALSIAEQYVTAFGKLAKNSNTLIVPSNPSDASGMVAQAMSIYKQLMSSGDHKQSFPTTPPLEEDDLMAELHSDDEADSMKSDAPPTKAS